MSLRTRFETWSEHTFRLINLKSYFTVVSLKDMGLSKDYKMTSSWVYSERGAFLVCVGSLPANMCGY